MDTLEKIRIADPETHTWVKGRIALLASPPDALFLNRLADETVWALSQEVGLGRTVAEGILQLMAAAGEDSVTVYIGLVREAAQTGPTLARLLATHLVAVIKSDDLLEQFLAALKIMRRKGTYTLSEPLEILTELLNREELPAARAFLDLLAATFGQEITYNHSVRLVYVIPKAVRAMAPRRRAAQIQAMTRVVRTDLNLLDDFLEGLAKGVALLGPAELDRFVDQALAKYRQSPESARAFISLGSQLGQAAAAGLRTTVALNEIKNQFDRYLSARLSRPVAVKPLSASGLEKPDGIWICSDGRFIYLPEEIDAFDRHELNVNAAKTWMRLEAGFFEYGTFAFDLERAADFYPEVKRRIEVRPTEGNMAEHCDAERFFAFFECPTLAEDLFNLLEQARVMRCLAHAYPGLAAQTRPVLQYEIQRLKEKKRWQHPLARLYEKIVLPPFSGPNHLVDLGEWEQEMEELFQNQADPGSPVEMTAALTCLAYDRLAPSLNLARSPYSILMPPFGRRLRWELVTAAQAGQGALARRIKAHLDQQGLQVYRSDVQNRLDSQQGRLSSEDIRTLVLMRSTQSLPAATVQVDWSNIDLNALFQAVGIDPLISDDSRGKAFYYPEWDSQQHDYLPDHVRVQETEVIADGDGQFYRQALQDHQGLVARVRRAFEFLKPEGLVILRQWPEGDAFDYRALIDFAVDRRAGRIPSDRLFIKRLKQERDVAVLLLVDLSRSTANPVIGGQQSVLDVAKEALVLFCEALQVVGDTYAMAGFSGTGRHSVDYFRIKDFETPLNEATQGRLSALRPQRSTRMGAAIRHATSQLATAPSRVRLLIVVSDGFPNDLGYKADYAIADTRRAVQEARARNLHVKAITVNIGSDPRLDDLYGRMHHHVIGDVRELPDKLLRLYGTLTRRM
ncbi:MAG: VWA domain-containing protein [Desulfobacteraceae bacterium]|nr:VWA domain-containing protein [Desulfobacteraceae bacterium]